MELAEWLMHWAALKNEHTLVQLSSCLSTNGPVAYPTTVFIGTPDPNQTSQVNFICLH